METLRRGQEAYASNDLAQAQNYFEAVLHEDPTNRTAIRTLRHIADKKAQVEKKNYATTRSRMLEEVQAAWNRPKAEGEPVAVENSELIPSPDQIRTEALCEKLETILIPAISFQDADIQQVVLELSALCRKLDPKRKGANLVVFGTAGTPLPPVTFSGTDLTALETLDIITQMAGMKYEITPNLVSLTPVNYEPPRQMVSVEFDINPSVATKMTHTEEDNTGPDQLQDVRSFFSTVPFPPSSSARFNSEFNILLVRNAPKYIDQIETLLNRYNRKAMEERSRQVEIETKFIEVAEGALDELGFEWTLGKAGEFINSDTWAIPGGQKLFTDTLRSGEDAFSSSIDASGRATSFNSYGSETTDPLGDGLVGTAGELLVQKIKGDVPVDLVIRALEHDAGSDLLSAPKILTKSGETARIHVGEVHWFPLAFSVEVERDASPALTPLDYQEELTGVLLEVTPELDPESGTIDMKLSPEIRELAGYDEQHVSTILPDFGDEALDMDGAAGGSDLLAFLTAREETRTINADRLIARRPVFKTRKVDTTVSIEDGSTIAMGGLIKEKMETYRDSVPILGKIPLIGRLFRSEGEHSVKRNLLIFVTANQVDASGHRQTPE